MQKLARVIFYQLKPFIPRGLQLWLRRRWVNARMPIYKNKWPISKAAGVKPAGWRGWPQDKKFALVLTHDVEWQKGHDRCLDLMRVEKNLGFKSSFNFVPERYRVSGKLRQTLEDNGFEVGVHGLNHDGQLFKNRKIFNERAKKINAYIKEWGVKGFRSPAMHKNLAWMHDLDIVYDLSTFDVDPFEPDSEGVNTIFPFWVSGKNGSGYLELPYTLAQDITLFILMRKRNINIWKSKLDWIVEKGGMALINVHPDYLDFGNGSHSEEFPILYYEKFLKYIKTNYVDQYWNGLPLELSEYFMNKTSQIETMEI